MTEKTYSLRRRLLAMISLPILLAGALVGALAMGFIYHEIGEVYDAQMVETAKLLLMLTEHELELPREQGLVLGQEDMNLAHLYEKKTFFRIWKDGQLVVQSASAGVFNAKPAPQGFSLLDADSDGSYWRIFSYADEDRDLVVEVAQDNEVRTELILQLLGSLFLPAAIFVPLILFFVWRGTTRSLSPMLSLARQVNHRGAEDLTPLATTELPEEISPFVSALNRLFRRVENTLQRERSFTDNAAHELRTPLAAMKTNAQVLLKKAAALPDFKEGLGNLLESIDRATQMVGQLLQFARLQNISEPQERVDMSATVEDVLKQLSPMALSRQQVLEVQITPGLHVYGYANALGVLAGNLVDNAIKYTPEEGRIEVSLSLQNQKIVLEVRDSGPGIAPEYREKVFERFFRIHKNQAMGSGLGLAMVRWIADMHHAEIELSDNTPHGLIIRTFFLAPDHK